MRRRHCPLTSRSCLALALGLGALIAGVLGIPRLALSRPSAIGQGPSSTYLRPSQPCPADVQQLVNLLLGDLPSYANRVASRNLDLSRRPLAPITTVLIVSPPNFTSIDLAELNSRIPGQDHEAALEQVFFTTLERQFRQNRVVSLQHHHWLFLTQTPEGWRMALLYSSIGTLPPENRSPGRPPTPPQESSDGIVGQAVRLWLRDCRAEAVFPAPAETVPSDVPLDVPSDVPLDAPADFPSRDLPSDTPESVPLEPEPDAGTRP